MNVLESKRMKRQMERRIINVPMSEAEILLLHGGSVFWDGHTLLTKIIRKRVSPVAMRLLKENKYGESN